MPPRNDEITPWDDLSPEKRRRESRKMELYAAMVDNLDDHVGRLIGYLKRAGLYDDTLIVFMSDNGAAAEDFYNLPFAWFQEYLREHFSGRTEVAILEGIPGHETAEARLQGFLDAVKPATHIRVVASQPANWERDLGFNVFQNILQAHREIDALFACNDMMALGAIEAIAAAGKTGEIMIIGFDAVEDGRAAIREGSMEASVAQYPYEMGRLAVESAVCTLAGETLPEKIPVPLELIRTENLENTDEPSESQNRPARAGTPGHPLCARSG